MRRFTPVSTARPPAVDTVEKGDVALAGSRDGASVPTLLGRKSLLFGMLTSVGFVFANAAQPSVAAAADDAVAYVPKWAPFTPYVPGHQVISPNNDVVAARIGHTSSAAYATDTVEWTLSSTYLTPASASATYGRVKGSCLGRFIGRANAGETLKITCLGDSILEGKTVTTPATDGMMILLAADLSTRFATTVTQTNRAASGFTALRAWTDAKVSAALADKADLYIVSAFDKNDIGAEAGGVGGLYVPGYPQTQSLGAIERMVRGIRTSVPKADIIILATNPYTAASSYNAFQQSKDRAVRRIAATYGCEFVDGYAAFVALGVYSTHMLDSTHPNTAGHRLLADTVLGHLSATPALTVAPGAVGATGLFNPEQVDAVYASLTTADAALKGLVWTNTGTFTGTGGSSAYITSTPGNYSEFAFTGTELAILMHTTLAENPVLDVTVDSVIVAANQGFTNGKQGGYYVPIAVGLTPGPHTVRLTLKSGTLKIERAAFVKYAPSLFAYETRAVRVFGPATGVTLTTAYQGLTPAVTVPLPIGWGSMDVFLNGYASFRVRGSTTAIRRIDLTLMEAGINVDGIRQMGVEVKAATFNLPQMPLTGMVPSLARAAVFSINAKLDVADNVQSMATFLDVLLIRKS